MPVSEHPTNGHGQTSILQGGGDNRRSFWDHFQASGVSGVLFGASGDERRQFLFALAVIAMLVVAGNVSNVLTVHHDAPHYGFFKPILWEASSAITLLAFVWIPWRALRVAPLHGRPIWRTGLVHAAGLLSFTIAHVAGFVLIRNAVYLAVGEPYGIAPLTSEFFYEFRKDALSYLTIVAVFWVTGRLQRTETTQTIASAGPAFVDIRDGARLDRVRVEDILAVTSADNYVEFVLSDGRRLMTRKSLAAVEQELGGHGFLRTHRSWLVNARRMTALKPEGSGDYTVELGALSVPLSRRFPEALAELRAGPR
jgi:DNA-binding LytR/AlgR family response regulator